MIASEFLRLIHYPENSARKLLTAGSVRYGNLCHSKKKDENSKNSYGEFILDEFSLTAR